MPVIDHVGQSEYTSTKETHYGKILGWHMGVAQGAIKGQRKPWRKEYLLIDATSGRGTLEDGSQGSPLVAVEKLRRLTVPWRSVFIEQNLDVFASLHSVLPMTPNVEKRCASYQDVIDAMKFDAHQLGLFYVDPNGTPDFQALRKVARVFPCLEILVSVSCTGVKRAGKLDAPIDEWLGRIGKRYWLIRKPYTSWHWTFLFGSDTPLFNKPYSSIEMEPTTSELGRHWLEIASYTEKQRLGKVQPPLTGLMPNTCDTQPTGLFGPSQSGERAAPVSDARRGL